MEQIINKLQQIENSLYYYNSKIVSLNWIGLNRQPTRRDIEFLNDFLAQRIKEIREVKELLENEKH